MLCNCLIKKMFLKKRAQSMSMNTVIIAALALIVLIVLIVIFSGKMNIFGKGTSSCTSQGGTCTSQGVTYAKECLEKGTCQCNGENEAFVRGTDCEKTSGICCKKVY
jgi:hypothetical protein